MRFFLALFILSQLPVQAVAGEYAVMMNLNYSQKEWEAFKAASERCGRTPVSVPPEELIPVGEALFAKRDALGEKIKAARPNWKKDQIDGALEEIMRNGAEWQGDPEIAQAYAQSIRSLHAQTKALNKIEEEYGSIASQFEETSNAIRRARGSIGSVAISAHADGWNFTGESANRLSWGDLDEVLRRNPRTFRDTQHVLLLGCYNMTANNRQHWNTIFPYATMIAGFGVKAPMRTQKIARSYITENLDTACRLDQEMAEKGRPLNPAYVEEQFKKLPSVTGTQSVIDYCRQVIEGQKGAGNALSCDEQWTTMMAQAEQIQNTYLDLRDMKKDPPRYDSATSELRIFYSALQGICPAKQAKQMEGQDADYEFYRRSIIENTIRLIFWWKVQKNFNTYYQNELADLEEALAAAGVQTQIPALDGTTGRVEFVRAFNAMKDELNAKKKEIQRARLKRGSRDLDRQLEQVLATQKKFEVLRPLFYLQGEHTVGIGDSTDTEGTLAREAIPFNWIEGTVLRPRSQQ